MPAIVESRRGISPPRAPRHVREPLDSYDSRCWAVAMTKPSMERIALYWHGKAAKASLALLVRFGQILQGLVTVMVKCPMPDRPADGRERFRSSCGQESVRVDVPLP